MTNLLVQKQVVDSLVVGRFAHEDWADWRDTQVDAHAGTPKELRVEGESTGCARMGEGVRRSGARKVRMLGGFLRLRDCGFRLLEELSGERFGA